MAMGTFYRCCCDCFEVIFVVTTPLFLPGFGNLLAWSDFWYHIFHSTYFRFHFHGTLVASLSFLLNSLRLFHVLPVYTNNHRFLRLSKKRITMVGQAIRKHPFSLIGPDHKQTSAILRILTPPSSSLRHLPQCFSFKNPLRGCVLLCLLNVSDAKVCFLTLPCWVFRPWLAGYVPVALALRLAEQWPTSRGHMTLLSLVEVCSYTRILGFGSEG